MFLPLWACGAAGSALPWHGRGHRFDPDQVHHPNTLNIKQLPALALQPLLPSRVRKGADFFHFHWQHHFNDFYARLALLRINRASVNIKRRAAARMSDKFLDDFNVRQAISGLSQVNTEAVPTDLLSDNSDPRSCGANALLQNAVRTKGPAASERETSNPSLPQMAIGRATLTTR